MHLRKTFLGIIALGFIVLCSAQELFQHPAAAPPYLSETLPSVYIECGDALEWMFEEENWYSNVEHPATFTFVSENGSETVEEVGFRLRGNTSRAAAKKSFKVAFNSFDADASWQGLKKLNLNGEHNDPSTMRARLVWESFRDAGIPVSRSTHIKLFLNGEYHGIYLSSEHLDGRWLNKRFPFGHGNLWKCTYPAELTFISNDPDDYKFTAWSEQRVYELKTNEAQDDYTALAEFIDALNNSNDSELPCALEAVFDVEGYLKTMAGEILVGHWDNYIGNKNNFYLYQRSFDERLMYLPYDADNTLGIQWFGEWTSQDPYAWTESSNRPLYQRILENDSYRDRFSWYLDWWMENWLTTEWALERGEWIQSLLSQGIDLDAFYSLDYGFTAEDFEASVSEPWGNHVAHGIVPFVESRNFWAEVQIEPSEEVPNSTPFAWAKGPIMNDTLLVQAWAHEAQDADSWNLLAEIEFPDGSSTSAQMAADMNQLHGTLWQCSIPMNGNGFAHWQVHATTPNGSAMQSPCSPRKIWNSMPINSIIINEVMPKNSLVYADAEGEHQDWAELYNASNEAINLTSFFLSNRWSDPSRWAIPNVTLDPGAHLLVWCDDESEEGPLHASFNLDASGDELLLFRREDNEWRLSDSVSWTAATENESYGRDVDGSSEWVWFEFLSQNPPTPNAPNGATTEITPPFRQTPEEIWSVYALGHSSVADRISKLPFYSRWNVWSIDGKIISNGHGNDLICTNMSTGFFILEYHDEENNLSGFHRFYYTN